MTKKKDYEVGYGKPPKEHQFKKGQSGNDKGRPKKVIGEFQMRHEDVRDLLLRSLKQAVPLKKNGEITTMPYIMALFEKIKQDALKGDRYARKYLLEMMATFLTEKFELKMQLAQVLYDSDIVLDENIEKIIDMY